MCGALKGSKAPPRPSQAKTCTALGLPSLPPRLSSLSAKARARLAACCWEAPGVVGRDPRAVLYTFLAACMSNVFLCLDAHDSCMLGSPRGDGQGLQGCVVQFPGGLHVLPFLCLGSTGLLHTIKPQERWGGTPKMCVRHAWLPACTMGPLSVGISWFRTQWSAHICSRL